MHGAAIMFDIDSYALGADMVSAARPAIDPAILAATAYRQAVNGLRVSLVFWLAATIILLSVHILRPPHEVARWLITVYIGASVGGMGAGWQGRLASLGGP
jgi:hypothetical protein